MNEAEILEWTKTIAAIFGCMVAAARIWVAATPTDKDNKLFDSGSKFLDTISKALSILFGLDPMQGRKK